ARAPRGRRAGRWRGRAAGGTAGPSPGGRGRAGRRPRSCRHRYSAMLGPQRAHAAELAVEALDAQLLEPGAEQLEHHAAEIVASWQDVLEQSPHRLGGGARMSIKIEAAELHAPRKVDLDHPIEVQAT